MSLEKGLSAHYPKLGRARGHMAASVDVASPLS